MVFAKIGFTPPPEAQEPAPPSGSRPGRRPVRKEPARRPPPGSMPREEGSAQRPAPVGTGPIPVVPAVSDHGDEVETLPSFAETMAEQAHVPLMDDEEEIIPETRRLNSQDWLLLATTPIIALACTYFFWPKHILNTLMILVHEMGHAIVGWLFGYPSLPAFDLQYGGGVTIHVNRWTALLILIYAGFAALIFLYRKNIPTLVLLCAVVAIHGFMAFTSWHEALILFMGHGTELVIAAIFIYRAVSGSKVVHAIERPMYGVIGFYIVFADMVFRMGPDDQPGPAGHVRRCKGRRALDGLQPHRV